MNNTAIVCRIKNIHPHSNADKVQLGTASGYQVVVGLDIQEGQLGVYFPTDVCLGVKFAEHNPDLMTYFGTNRRVRTQRFRGEKSEGFWVSIEALSFFDKKLDEDEEIDNPDVCYKYINPNTLRNREERAKNLAKKFRTGSLPTFQKHVETEHLRKEWDKIDRSRQWIWTAKAHGTSARVTNGLVRKELSWWEKLLKKLYVPIEEYQYEYLIGSRNVILGELKPDGSVGKDGFYSDEFRRRAAAPFLGNLHKGEVIYYEVVGYSDKGKPIMPSVEVKDKDIRKVYGNKVTYAYGCKDGELDIYVYRIAYQTIDGQSIDLSWDQVKARCLELGVKHVPEVNPGSSLEEIQYFIERPDIIDPSHPLEGVVLRVEGSKPEFYKEKSFTFKVLEGIIKDAGGVDLEEAS